MLPLAPAAAGASAHRLGTAFLLKFSSSACVPSRLVTTHPLCSLAPRDGNTALPRRAKKSCFSPSL